MKVGSQIMAGAGKGSENAVRYNKPFSTENYMTLLTMFIYNFNENFLKWKHWTVLRPYILQQL